MTTHQIVLILIILIITCFIMSQSDSDSSSGSEGYKKNKKNKEDFGALQSLYSNDGIQDQYLTTSDSYFDPYKYWRSVPWNLPTRNLNEMVFYPFLYENIIDRYGVVYPYW